MKVTFSDEADTNPATVLFKKPRADFRSGKSGVLWPEVISQDDDSFDVVALGDELKV